MTFEMLFVYTITAAAATMDIREFRIPNWLNLLGLFFVLFFRVIKILNELVRGGSGSLTNETVCLLLGILVAFVETYPMFVLRGIGAGDVKLLCVLGAMLGPQRITGLIAVSYVGAGIIGIALLIRQIFSLRKTPDIWKESIRSGKVGTGGITFHVINFSLVICSAVMILPLVDHIAVKGWGGSL